MRRNSDIIQAEENEGGAYSHNMIKAKPGNTLCCSDDRDDEDLGIDQRGDSTGLWV